MEGLSIQSDAKERSRGGGVNNLNNKGAMIDKPLPTSYTESELTEIPKGEITKGNEDLYILKSQIVPPVCPKCPDVKQCNKEKDCSPCPAPQRCPDKPFECKMVPKYNDPNVSTYLPKPVLDSFNSFA